MSTIVINGITYKFPDSIIEHNSNLDPEDFYNKLTLEKIFSGYDEFDRLEAKGFNYLSEEYCECWQLYADLHGIESLDDERLLISSVGESMYAIFTDYKNEEHTICILEKV